MSDQVSRAGALDLAHQLTSAASRDGFDWPDISGVWAKVREEMVELEEAAREGNPGHVAAELGDLLFSVVNLSRFLAVDPEQALVQTCERFQRRYGHVQAGLLARGRRPGEATLEEMEDLWQEAKRRE